MPLSGLQTALLLLIPSLFLYNKWRKRGPYLLPPGPKGWPIIGNALDIPLDNVALVYASWAKQHDSEIVSVSAFGTTVVVIDSYDIAVELLDRRAAKYSSRPPFTMVRDLMGYDYAFLFEPYTNRWKTHRRRFVQFFRADTNSGASIHTPRIYEFVHRLVLDISETPNEFFELVRHRVGGLTISLTYGLPVKRRHDPLVEFADYLARTVLREVIPGKHAVDGLPILKYVPSWFPGAGFKRYGESIRWMSVDLKMKPYEEAVEAFGAEGIRSSFVSERLASLDNPQEAPEEVAEIQDVASTIYGTANDTTTNAILTFLFAISTHAEIRKKVQAEADAVLTEESGALRLPTLEDQEKMPRLEAAIMESHRWAPILPIGGPHRTSEDDVFEGYYIPKGAIVVANQWSMLNDEKVFGADPDSFNPDRFLRSKGPGDVVEINTDVRHPRKIMFGFGRRSCPGIQFAEQTLWLAAACFVTLFEFEAPDSEKANFIGQDGKIDSKFDQGFTCARKKFPCDFKPRSPNAAKLLAELGMGFQA